MQSDAGSTQDAHDPAKGGKKDAVCRFDHTHYGCPQPDPAVLAQEQKRALQVLPDPTSCATGGARNDSTTLRSSTISTPVREQKTKVAVNNCEPGHVGRVFAPKGIVLCVVRGSGRGREGVMGGWVRVVEGRKGEEGEEKVGDQTEINDTGVSREKG